MSPVRPPATTVGEPGIFAFVTHDRTVVGFQSYAQGIACGLTNPRSVRRYAEAMGILEKTDRLDASVIARFAIAKDLKPVRPPTKAQQRLNALVARLRQVTDDLTVQKQRRSNAIDQEMATSIDEVIALLRRQEKGLAGEIASLIDDDPLWSKLDGAMRTKGIADRTVARLLAELPEIGIYSNKAVVKRHIRGGRAGIRSILFLVADIVRRFDQGLAAFHRKLTAAGKPKMVVRIALARKLLVRLNARAREAREQYALAT